MSEAYKFYAEELNEKAPPHTLEQLRHKLIGKTWRDLAAAGFAFYEIDGVYFCPRIGSFLGRRAIAVLAQKTIVVMRFIAQSRIKPDFVNAPLTNNEGSGFMLLPSDFGDRIIDVKLTDLVISEDADEQQGFDDNISGTTPIEQS